jgi:hypothetical protein
MSVKITIEGKDVDVTTCARQKCVSPRPITPFSSKEKKDAYREEMKKWHECITRNCEAEARKKLGLTTTLVTGLIGSVPVSKPAPTSTVNVVQNEPRPDTTANQGYKAGEEEEKESWFKANRNTVIIGGVLIVLAVGGVIMYRKMKKK